MIRLGCMTIQDYVERPTCCRRYKGNRHNLYCNNNELIYRLLESKDFLDCFYVKDGKIRGERDWNKILGYFINDKVVENELTNGKHS